MKKQIRKEDLVVDARMINSSGIGTYLKNILPIISNNFNLTLLGDLKELASFEWTKGLKIIEFNLKIYSLKEQLLYPFIIPKTDLFWCPHFNAPFLPIRAKKMLTTIYDVNHLANKESSSFAKWIYAKLLYALAVRKSEKIITISKFSKAELLKYTNAKTKKIKIVYCGVDFVKFTNVYQNLEYEVPEKYILYVGNIKPHKNLLTLLKAYKILPENTKQTYKLVILGKKEGFITPDLEIFKFIEEHSLMKYIFFTGYVEDYEVPLIYQKASLFVFPSLYEGFGLPVLEAMASGVPVLTSNATSLPEVGGEAAMYFDPTNFNELSVKIQEFVLNQELGKMYVRKGKLQARRFSWETAGKRHIEIIDDLINESSTHGAT
nr:glycosyltransferase family 1 protein [uncultured Allomuricauda sp.]